MTQPIDSNQLVSDLLDEQITSDDLALLITQDDSKESLFRYTTVSELLRDQHSAQSSMSFVDSVSQRIASEPTVLAPFSKENQTKELSNESNIIPLFAKFKKASGGMAIAASVAVATFFSVQTLQVAQEGDLIHSEIASQAPISSNEITESTKQWLETDEQKELELFNYKFMSKARQSEQDAIAPFARAVRGQSIGTIRFSKEQWENLLSRSYRLEQEKKQKEKNKENQ